MLFPINVADAKHVQIFCNASCTDVLTLQAKLFCS